MCINMLSVVMLNVTVHSVIMLGGVIPSLVSIRFAVLCWVLLCCLSLY
jgi:hypothetical protein